MKFETVIKQVRWGISLWAMPNWLWGRASLTNSKTCLGKGMVTVSQPNLIHINNSVHTMAKKSHDCLPNFKTSLEKRKEYKSVSFSGKRNYYQHNIHQQQLTTTERQYSRIIKKLEHLSESNSTPRQNEQETDKVDPVTWLHPQNEF